MIKLRLAWCDPGSLTPSMMRLYVDVGIDWCQCLCWHWSRCSCWCINWWWWWCWGLMGRWHCLKFPHKNRCGRAGEGSEMNGIEPVIGSACLIWNPDPKSLKLITLILVFVQFVCPCFQIVWIKGSCPCHWIPWWGWWCYKKCVCSWDVLVPA